MEAVNAAAFAAPTAMGFHKFGLWLAGDCTNVAEDCNNAFVFLSWVGFFFHSIAWKYVIRRVYDRYDIELNPKALYKYVKKRLLL